MHDIEQRRLAAILAADAVGYSRMVRADEDGALRAFRELREKLVEPVLDRHGGRLVKSMGDGYLVEFSSVVNAVRAAMEIQDLLSKRNAARPENEAIRLRMGINLGDVVIDGDDIQGDGINVAARLEALAKPGSVCVSGAVYDQVRNRVPFAFEDLGRQRLKNIDEPIPVWRLCGPKKAPAHSEQTEAAEHSVAVLPFDNRSNDREQEYFADGITDDIITALSKIDGLAVISRNSAFVYKGRPTPAQEICKALNVRYILEGSVRKVGQRVRITSQLVEGKTGAHVWAERYDRDLADIFAVQDDVTDKIVSALEVKLARESPSAEKVSPEAYDLLLRAREHYRRFTPEDNRAARNLFAQALETEPDYASALAGLAETHVQDWLSGKESGLDGALATASRAGALNPRLPLVNEALSTVFLFRRQHDDAIEAAGRWIEVEPGNAESYANLAGILGYAGEPQRVAPLIERAKRLNPFYPFYYPLYVAQADFTLGRLPQAIENLTRSIAQMPDAPWPHIYLAACHGRLGNKDLARREGETALQANSAITIRQIRKISAYRNEADLERLLEGLSGAGIPD